MRPALLILLLTGCAPHQFTRECAFGAETEARAAVCVRVNFGEAAAREFEERMTVCETLCESRDAWCEVNCGQ